jgi:M6 family metalloprotease-like protein
MFQVMATFAPTQELYDEGYETVHMYRKRLDIDYQYNPIYVSSELCRNIPEDDCKGLDEAFGEAIKSNRKILRQIKDHRKKNRTKDDEDEQGDGRRTQDVIEVNPLGNLNVLVLLVQWTNHMDKELIPRDTVDILFNSDQIDADLIPTGSVKRYFDISSYSQFGISATVADWTLAPNTEAFYASQGDSGRDPGTIPAFTPALQALEDSGFDFRPFDLDGDGFMDLTVILHSGYAAELGGTDCNDASATRERRIASHASSAGFEPDWFSSQGIELGAYVVASSFRQRCQANVARLGVIVHEIVHPFGIVDLYDFQGALDPSTGNIGGLDRYDVMVRIGWRMRHFQDQKANKMYPCLSR